MTAGVYQISHVGTGKLYIGSSANMQKRRGEHFSRLRKNRHANQRLQRAFNKYGEEAFEWTVLLLVPSVALLVPTEQSFIDLHNPFYNICRIAGTSLGRRHTDIARHKISTARKGPGNGMFCKKHSDEAVQKIADSSMARANTPVTLAALELGRGWNKGIPFSAVTRQKMSDAKPKKPVRKINIATGETMDYTSISTAARDGFHKGHITECCRGRGLTHAGYKWEFINAS